MSKGTYRRRMLLVFKLAVSLFFIWFVLSRIDLSLLKECLKGGDYLEFFFAIITLVAGGFFGVASWRSVLKSKGQDLPFLRVAAMHWCGMFFNSFFPSNIGGDFYKGYLLVKGNGKGTSLAVVSILLDRLINFALLVLIGVISFCFAKGLMITASLAFVAFILFVLLLRVLSLRKYEAGNNRVLLFVFSLIRFFRDGRNCAAAFLAALFSQGFKIGCHVFLIRAMGLDLDTNCVWYIVPLFGVISALPVSLGGIGVREYAAIWVAAPLAMAQEDLVALSLVSHLLFVCVNCLGFVPFLIMRNENSKCL
ncbi:MAG: lysylphosphatidylglycerol synthase transmembrane domain-containing protein [Kiritimatiellae bacterium]|nr:lysylphosphatidylglycerol synthase transmembrane domain-containing protein [Kiritimatiellia bacterium]